MLRREIRGNVVSTTLITGGIAAGDVSITLTNGASFPVGSASPFIPFVITIDRGLAAEEKILVTSRSGNVLTVSARGYDGSTANSHLATAVVDHILDAASLQDMNTTVYDTKILTWMGL